MKIKVAFYCGKGTWINRVVRWWTRSRYSHAELVMPDGITWIGISPFKTSKLCARLGDERNLLNWDLIEIEVTENQLSVINEFYESTKGCRYDWIGMILSQVLPYHIKRKGKWYCSEWIAYALRISCVIDWKLIKIYDRADLSPAVLYEILKASKKCINFV
tara:strand:+ start:10532 stop:11014 length:483 start_codon:yes stop_codon:yes gene_type:complete